MRKVFGFLTGLFVALGVAVMIFGIALDWQLFPSRKGAGIAWSVGFWGFIVVGGICSYLLYMSSVEAEDTASSKKVRMNAGPGAEQYTSLSRAALAENERKHLAQVARESEAKGAKEAEQASDATGS